MTLDPFQEEKQAPKPVEKQDPVMDDAILTPEEKADGDAVCTADRTDQLADDLTVRCGNSEEDGGFFRERARKCTDERYG